MVNILRFFEIPVTTKQMFFLCKQRNHWRGCWTNFLLSEIVRQANWPSDCNPCHHRALGGNILTHHYCPLCLLMSLRNRGKTQQFALICGKSYPSSYTCLHMYTWSRLKVLCCKCQFCFRAQMRELRRDAVCARLGQLRAVQHTAQEEQLSRAALRRPNHRQRGGDPQEGDENVSEGVTTRAVGGVLCVYVIPCLLPLLKLPLSFSLHCLFCRQWVSPGGAQMGRLFPCQIFTSQPLPALFPSILSAFLIAP